jgi:molybdate transport system ATP-binding protein
MRARFNGRFGDFRLDAGFEAPAVGVTALFGPSGCGKTSVLRCIAGLQRADGAFGLRGDIWQDATTFLPAHERPIGYVFQEASLFPHLSVEGNLRFGQSRARRTGKRAPIDKEEVIALLGLDPLLGRAPARLSGGERQRVAIGRALLSQPALLLMDEPLSALDKPTRDEILPFLERLHGALSIPILYVSHDLAEVERLADHLVLMEAGRVTGSGPLAALQSDPSLPLIRNRDAAASLDARVTGYDPAYGLLTLDVEGGSFVVPAPPTPPGQPRRLRIAAGDVSLATAPPAGSSIINILPARIVGAAETGPAEMTAVLGLGADGAGARLLARITRRSWDQLGLAQGSSVYAQVKGVALAAAGSSEGEM